MSMLALFFPWVVLLVYDNPGGAVVALILQATIIGWLPASVWAWRVVHHQDKPKSEEQIMSEEKHKVDK